MFKSLKDKVFTAILDFCIESKINMTPEKYDDSNIINFYHCSVEIDKNEIAIAFDLDTPPPFSAEFGAFMKLKFGKKVQFYVDPIFFDERDRELYEGAAAYKKYSETLYLDSIEMSLDHGIEN